MIYLIAELTSIGQLPRQWKGFLIDKDLELSKRAKRLRHSRKTIKGREVFLGHGGIYEQETLEYFNTDLKYNHQWHESSGKNREMKHH